MLKVFNGKLDIMHWNIPTQTFYVKENRYTSNINGVLKIPQAVRVTYNCYAYRINLFCSPQTHSQKYIHVNKKDIPIYSSNTSQARDSQSQCTGRTENSRTNLSKY